MKLAGVDYGRRRIGVAVTDENGTLVKGLPTIAYKDIDGAVRDLCAVIGREKPGVLVFGLALDADGGDTAMATECRKFAADIGSRCGLPVRFVDESYTSVRAAELLMFRKRKQRRDKGAADRIAACLILDTYLKEVSCSASS